MDPEKSNETSAMEVSHNATINKTSTASSSIRLQPQDVAAANEISQEIENLLQKFKEKYSSELLPQLDTFKCGKGTLGSLLRADFDAPKIPGIEEERPA